MSEETRRILELLAQQKITVEEADELLRAVRGAPAEPSGADADAEPQRRKWRGVFGFGAVRVPPGEAPGLRYLKIEVNKSNPDDPRHGRHVKLRVPIALVRSGMRLGAIVGGYADEDLKRRLRERGIDLDWSKLDDAQIEDVLKNLGEVTVNVDRGQSQVRITCE